MAIILSRLIQIDQEWVPHSESSSLYIRPTLIGTEGQLGVAPAHEAELFVILSPVGPYFSTGVKPVNLVRFVVTNTEYVHLTQKSRIARSVFVGNSQSLQKWKFRSSIACNFSFRATLAIYDLQSVCRDNVNGDLTSVELQSSLIVVP